MKYRRRRYIVDIGLQARFIVLFVLVSFFGSIASLASFNYFALKKLNMVMWSTHLKVNTTGELIGPLFMYINIIDFLFVSVLLIIAGVWMSRKVSGPLYRMSKDIRKVTDGDLSTTIILRRGDEFKDTAHEVNLMVKHIRDRLNTISEKYTGISKYVEGFKLNTGNKDALAKDSGSLLENIEDITGEINSFKIKK